MGRHSAPDDDEGDLLVEAPPAPSRPLPRPRHAVADEPAELVTTRGPRTTAETDSEVIDPELVERAPQSSPREVIDAVVVEDESLPVRVATPKPAPFETSSREPASAAVSLVKSGPAPTNVAAGGTATASSPAPAGTTAPTGSAKERPTRVDLRLLRQDGALRARAAAAVLVPFVLYTLVLAIIGRFGVYLFWIWIPAILAGVLFGAQLDAAVRRGGDQGSNDQGSSDQGSSSPSPPAP